MSDIIRTEARLIFLRVLAAEPNYSGNDSLLQQHLDTFGIARSRDWVREELRWLADQGALRLTDVGTARIATLLPKGVDHVERRIVLDGVKRPSPHHG